MNILPNIKIIDLSLYLEKEKILILSDFHLGYEEALNKQGILIPRFQFEEIIKRLKKIFKKVKPSQIIINGDIKHEFGTISTQEWRHTLQLLDFLLEKAPVTIIKGNHDKIIKPITQKRNIEVIEEYRNNNILITHGDKLKKPEKTTIIAHEHPSIAFKERPSEKYKCFLLGKYKNSSLIVQPSFNLVTEGSNIVKNKLLSPFLKDIQNFQVFIVEDKVYKFKTVKDFD
ncbi:phosphoesterase [archaeon]|nr:phosphoesterase [archaeon]|tara:strand:+ start:1485 stop:2171 length:687 start_codon:yes stop_codon:yes gene_type:complete